MLAEAYIEQAGIGGGGSAPIVDSKHTGKKGELGEEGLPHLRFRLMNASHCGRHFCTCDTICRPACTIMINNDQIE